MTHHAASYAVESGDKAAAEALKADFRTAGLDPLDLAICEFATRHAVTPAASGPADLERLRALGMSDRMILDMTLVIGAFAFFVRMADGLGAALEESKFPHEVALARELGKPVLDDGATKERVRRG